MQFSYGDVMARPGLDKRSRQLATIAAQPEPPEGRRIYLRADKALGYGKVMAVMGELNRAGLNRVALVSVGDQPQ